LNRWFLILFMSLSLFGFDTSTASKIFEKIFTGIIHKEPVNVYTSNPTYQEVVKLSNSLELVAKPFLADIVFADSHNDIPKNYNGVIFTTNVSVFQTCQNTIGAFYWEHGRPKIYFLKQRLEIKKILLHETLKRYIVIKLP